MLKIDAPHAPMRCVCRLFVVSSPRAHPLAPMRDAPHLFVVSSPRSVRPRPRPPPCCHHATAGKMPAVTRRQHPRTARTPRSHAGCASLVRNKVQRGNRLQTRAFFPPCFPPAKPPSPSHGFHSRPSLLPVGLRFFLWAASSWLLG